MTDEQEDKPTIPQARAVLMSQAQGLRDLFEAQNEIFVEHSKYYHARYSALVAAGFNDAQAMQLITMRGLG